MTDRPSYKSTPEFDIAIIASSNEVLPRYLAVGDAVHETLASSWLQGSNRLVLRISLRDTSTDSWISLGSFILQYLLIDSGCFGVYADGAIPISIVSSWLYSARENYALSLSTIEFRITKHPMLASTKVDNLSLYIIQETDGGVPWLRSILTDIDSRLYDDECDLLVSVYDTDVVSLVVRPGHLTPSDFMGVLPRAAGWLVPLDSNAGFVVGIAAESELYRRLVASQKHRSELDDLQ